MIRFALLTKPNAPNAKMILIVRIFVFMMISIAARLHPYSHTPGTVVLLPGSSLQLEIFPTLIRVADLSSSTPKSLGEIAISLRGPVKDFTVEQNLERGFIHVWGHAAQGYMRYKIVPCNDISCENKKSIAIYVEKSFKEIAFEGPFPVLFSPLFSSPHALPQSASSKERLSLGSHKAQDWDMISRRMDMRDILPCWLRLGQMIPGVVSASSIKGGTLDLLEACQEAVLSGYPERIIPTFNRTFQAGFEGLLSPRLVDVQHQGLVLTAPHAGSTPLRLLSEGALLIRSLFIKAEDGRISILPAVPPELPCGRFLEVSCGKLGSVSLEWTKKKVRRLIFTSAASGKLHFDFQSHIKGARLRLGTKDQGREVHSGELLDFEAGQKCFFDNFRQ